jgi:tRNA(Arg) A34 adenosine deaminase TadA
MGKNGPMARWTPDPPWDETLELAWQAFCTGTTPVGAVVTDAAGTVVTRGRGRRMDTAGPAGQLSGTRIAHAEVNALAQLPFAGEYGGHTLYTTTEPCCLCMGAAIQTGVGDVRFAARDPYGGASAMVLDNPQMRHKRMRVHGPDDPVLAWWAGLLVAVHYAVDRAAKPHMSAPMREAQPELCALADDSTVRAVFADARRAAVSVAELMTRLDGAGGSVPGSPPPPA